LSTLPIERTYRHQRVGSAHMENHISVSLASYRNVDVVASISPQFNVTFSHQLGRGEQAKDIDPLHGRRFGSIHPTGNRQWMFRQAFVVQVNNEAGGGWLQHQAVSCCVSVMLDPGNRNGVPIPVSDEYPIEAAAIAFASGCIDDARAWQRFAYDEFSLSPSLGSLPRKIADGRECSSGGHPPAESRYPFPYTVIFSSDAPRALAHHVPGQKIGTEPAGKSGEGSKDSAVKMIVFPHAGSDSTKISALARWQ